MQVCFILLAAYCGAVGEVCGLIAWNLRSSFTVLRCIVHGTGYQSPGLQLQLWRYALARASLVPNFWIIRLCTGILVLAYILAVK